MPIDVPKTPDGEQYHDFVSASLQVSGHFIETRVVLREGKKEVLELDVVATPTPIDPRRRVLYEAKKDGFSFSNIFKLYGQRKYLGIEDACLVSLTPLEQDFEKAYEGISKEIKIRLCNHTLDLHSLQNLCEVCNKLPTSVYPDFIEVAWFHHIAQRIAYSEFRRECNGNRGVEPYERAREYNLKVQTSFFKPTPLARAEGLYDAYHASPRLTGEIVSLLGESDKDKEKAIWNKVNDTHEMKWIQYLMLLEHSARITIIKNALDHHILNGDKPASTVEFSIGETKLAMPIHFLPMKFWAGVKTLSENPYALQIPYLFQIFIDLFGGFIFYKDDDELSLLESFTGIPKDEIVESLKLMDIFFQTLKGSWFFVIKDQLLVLKMIPGFVKGIGCFLRKSAYRLDDYSQKFTELGWLLSKWHNAAYWTLEEQLKTEG
jgi:hypothetical protein